MNVVICTSNSHISESQQLQAGALYFADSQVVRDNPGCFDDDLEKYALGDRPIVERATANPGEVRRGPGRPRKDS